MRWVLRRSCVLQWVLLALTVLVAVVWGSSPWYQMGWQPFAKWALWTSRGKCNLAIDPRSRETHWLPEFYPGDGFDHIEWFPQLVRDGTLMQGPPFTTSYALPLWPAVLLLGVPCAALWFVDAHIRRRVRAGLCPKCNYNRTGLAAAAPCPECGAAAPALPAARS